MASKIQRVLETFLSGKCEVPAEHLQKLMIHLWWEEKRG